MIRTCLLAGAMVAAWTASAAAADMRPAHKAPPPVLVQSWTGFYLGANVGWAWANDDVTWAGNPALFGPFTPLVDTAGTGGIDTNGFTAGVQAGFNYQVNAIVFGVEADINYTDLSGSRSVALPPPAVPGTTANSSFESNWLATFRGRIGVLVAPSLLAYVTGGLAIADVSVSDLAVFTAFPGTTNFAVTDEVRAGWTIGGGLEWAFASNWSAKLEYLYVDLGTVSHTSTNSILAGATILHEHDIKEHLVRVGVNYRFGGR